jgi:hypothetical protein
VPPEQLRSVPQSTRLLEMRLSVVPSITKRVTPPPAAASYASAGGAWYPASEKPRPSPWLRIKIKLPPSPRKQPMPSGRAGTVKPSLIGS